MKHCVLHLSAHRVFWAIATLTVEPPKGWFAAGRATMRLVIRPVKEGWKPVSLRSVVLKPTM